MPDAPKPKPQPRGPLPFNPARDLNDEQWDEHLNKLQGQPKQPKEKQ